MEIEKLRRRQRRAHLRFRALGVIVWVASIAAGTYLLMAASPRATVFGWLLIVLGAAMLGLRIYIALAARRVPTSDVTPPSE